MDRDTTAFDLRLVLSDDDVVQLLVGIQVEHREGCAEGDLLLLEGRRIDHERASDSVFAPTHAGVELRLALLGGVVLRVLAEIAVLERLFDCFYYGRAIEEIEEDRKSTRLNCSHEKI